MRISSQQYRKLQLWSLLCNKHATCIKTPWDLKAMIKMTLKSSLAFIFSYLLLKQVYDSLFCCTFVACLPVRFDNDGHKPWRPQTMMATNNDHDGHKPVWLWILCKFCNFLKVRHWFLTFSLLWPSSYTMVCGHHGLWPSWYRPLTVTIQDPSLHHFLSQSLYSAHPATISFWTL